MGKSQSDLSPERATAYRGIKHAEARALGFNLEEYSLVVDRENDVEAGGSGPRFAIVRLAQKMAAKGATYGQVLGQVVKKGDGKPFKIAEADLLGYVCANGYCRLVPPNAMTSVSDIDPGQS